MTEESVLQSSSVSPSCCGQLNVNHFWNSVGELVEKKKPSSNLLFEKNIYLDDERDCVIIVGVMPHKRFSIGARIEKKGSKCVVYLDKETLFDLIECVDEQFCENAVYPKSHRSVRIQLYDEQWYKICIGDEQRIKMCLATLLTLRQKHKLIKMQVNMIEKRTAYEKQFHKLLLHFCYDGDERVVVKAMQAPAHLQKQQLTDAVCAVDCYCIEKAFAVEMATNCADWFLACVPIFIRSLLLSAA